MPPRPYMFGTRVFVNGTVHLVDRHFGFSDEWVMFCGARLRLDANWPEKFGTQSQVNCLLCMDAEGGISIADVHR